MEKYEKVKYSYFPFICYIYTNFPNKNDDGAKEFTTSIQKLNPDRDQPTWAEEGSRNIWSFAHGLRLN